MAKRVLSVDVLLRDAIAYVPTYGFSMTAIRHAAMDYADRAPDRSGVAPGRDRDRALTHLFPGPDTAPTSAPRRLFQAWDDDMSTQMVSSAEPHADAAAGTPNDAFNATLALLHDRLGASGPVRAHLLPVRPPTDPGLRTAEQHIYPYTRARHTAGRRDAVAAAYRRRAKPDAPGATCVPACGPRMHSSGHHREPRCTSRYLRSLIGTPSAHDWRLRTAPPSLRWRHSRSGHWPKAKRFSTA